MSNVIEQLKNMIENGDVDGNQICQEYSSNPLRPLLDDILNERKNISRRQLNIGANHLEMEEGSAEIERILRQLTFPKFPVAVINEQQHENDGDLERQYYEDIAKIKTELENKECGLRQDHQRALAQIHLVLQGQKNYRPIDERDMINAQDGINRRFEKTRQTVRGEAATKILMLRRDIEQMCRKRKNFDKQTTEILQRWFNEHISHPYPTDKEKEDLAKQCGIKLSQVNNWFGNQRIRTKNQHKKDEPSTSNSDLTVYANPFTNFAPPQLYYPPYEYDPNYLPQAPQSSSNNQF
ncbi:unnamed protein product [Caenorhabditis angaria]|uniref:Homeobox domain-containing protein n=1 Tax=Caenorhabditis angaria TaxID=860376 RepID=A0A9P1J231_9PELO|nr:unnamed protein product [Caenorhabditis angaria]